ncbi:type I glyceraldehyde-3-phosphate dehydrogenase [Candidatus Neomarinimicrobiota bacterium]
MTGRRNSQIIRVGLMGFGRIGRNLFRLAAETNDVEIAVVSDLGKPEILHYLLQRDSIHGSFEQEEEFNQNSIRLKDGRTTRLIKGIAPGDIPWDGYQVDIVVDATGKYTSLKHMQAHLNAGAKRVIISNLPEEDPDRIVIMGVNDDTISAEDRLISAGSSTTNVMAIMLKALAESMTVNHAMMTSIHAFTSDQPLQDTAGADFRRSRSATDNIIPNSTVSPAWVEKIMPEFAGKLDGIALNVPVPDGSCLDITAHVKTDNLSVDMVNAAMYKFARKFPEFVEVTDDPIVSSDVIGNRHSVVLDTKATMIGAGKMLKIIGWYDNGWGHAARLLDIIKAYARFNDVGGAA